MPRPAIADPLVDGVKHGESIDIRWSGQDNSPSSSSRHPPGSPAKQPHFVVSGWIRITSRRQDRPRHFGAKPSQIQGTEQQPRVGRAGTTTPNLPNQIRARGVPASVPRARPDDGQAIRHYRVRITRRATADTNFPCIFSDWFSLV